MKYYITTPIYYVNDVPHIGHAYTSIAADVLANYQRLCGKDVFFLTGTDEHGAKIVQAAEKAGLSPKAFSDKISDEFKSSWKELKLNYDSFIRTTDPKHESAVKHFLLKLFDSGFIYKGKYEGHYCVQCEKFLSPGDLDEKQCCPDHRIKPVVHSEENYFFKLSAFHDKLLERLTNPEHPEYIAIHPKERRNEIIGKLKANPLEDISMSRLELTWGIPLPFDTKQTAYVWVDALLNYITAIGYEENSDQFKKLWPADCHLMAKDILWFHSVIWPAMLMGAGLAVPKNIFAHGFFTIDGQKMSKSIGNVIRPNELIQRFGVDAARYLLLALFPFGTDGDISWKALEDKYNVDLANNLGNLVSRTLTMVEKYCSSIVPSGVSKTTDFEPILKQYSELGNIDFGKAIEAIRGLVDSANRSIEVNAPWKMAKTNDPALPAVLYDLLANIGFAAILLLPFMPNTSSAIWSMIGEEEPIENTASRIFSDPLKVNTIVFPQAGRSIKKGGILFPRFTTK